MRSPILFLSLAPLTTPAVAQQSMPMNHDDHASHMGTGQTMDHASMMHEGPAPASATNAAPGEAGQSAFAAIQEIVTLLLADPGADWEQVNIDALRAHLVDMDNVILHANVKTEYIEGGARFTVTSADPAITASITRMITAHSGVMDGTSGWEMTSLPLENGAEMDVTGDADDAVKIRALGFFGMMTFGMHHQAHHLAIASGQNPHQH
ncbi:MAG: hypothetical protein R3256_07025 [Thalassovita sp.]|nr:hypothetical protein [Thalassovita sp.]